MIDAPDISASLAQLGVAPDDTIFVHSDLRGSLRLAGATGRAKMGTVRAGLRHSVPSGTLMMPTFTYSFTRDEPFDLADSRSTVGALTEWFRGQPGVRRTADPLFSVAVEGPVARPWEDALFAVGDKECFGPQSVFAYLREVDAKLVFYDVSFDACTYVHYLERLCGVPYRFTKRFAGIVHGEGRSTAVAVDYHVRELREETEVHLEPLAQALLDAGAASTATLPGGPKLLVTSARAVEEVARHELARNPSFVTRGGHETALHR